MTIVYRIGSAGLESDRAFPTIAYDTKQRTIVIIVNRLRLHINTDLICKLTVALYVCVLYNATFDSIVLLFRCWC